MYVKKCITILKKQKKTNAITSTFPKSAFQLHWETKYLTWLPTTSSNPGAHVKSKVLRHKVHPTTTTPKSKNSNKNTNKSNRDDDDNNNNNNNNIINNIDNMI